jgi:PAS domain S-box-containing protein
MGVIESFGYARPTPNFRLGDDGIVQDESDFIRSSKEAIIQWTLDGTILAWNPSAERLLGHTPEEIIGQPLSRITGPDLSNRLVSLIEHIGTAETIEDFETSFSSNTGVPVAISVTMAPIRDKEGIIRSVLCLGQDIRGRKELQQAERDQLFLASIISSANDAIVSKDLDGIITSWNAAAERIFGYTADEMIGQPVLKLIPPKYHGEEPQILARIRRGELIDHYQSERVAKDGRTIQVSLTISPIKDRRGRIIGASKIARDITENKIAEEREREILRQAQEAKRQADRARRQAEEASLAKDEFLAMISHELRTPLTAILGWTRMLVNGQVPPDQHLKAFEIIDRNARSQAQLIEDLLDVSRIISGKLRIEFKPLELSRVIASAVDALRPAAEAKDIRIEPAIPLNSGSIVGDAERLQQVVWNLLSNAIKFTPRRGLVQIELRKIDSQMELRVTDNGIGISPEFLPRVFDRFSQSDASLTRSHGGLGMGLAIVKSLVELHGGVIAVTSAGEGQGSAFTIKLPISALKPDPLRLRLSQGPHAHTELRQNESLQGIKVLVVDDEPDTCAMLLYVLNQCGATVQTANRVDEALAVFDKWQPDMLISDIGLPDIDGYDLIRAIRDQRKSRIPAVALTAMARVEDRLKALTAGYQMHVSKPVEPSELVAIVSGLVGLIQR